MVCDSFKPNVFKPDFCMQCQRPKSEHYVPPVEVKNKVACKEFVPNPFKINLCKICQLGKKDHDIVDVSSVVVIKKEPTFNLDSLCDSYLPNPFKEDLCKTCRLPRALHKGLSVIEKKPEISSKTLPKKAEVGSLKPAVSAPLLQKKETGNTNVMQKHDPVEAVTHIPNDAGVACDNFQPNPFKPVLCKDCRLHKSKHAAQALHDEPEKVSSSTQSKPNTVTGAQSIVSKKPPPRQVPQSDSDNEIEKQAVCSSKPIHTKQPDNRSEDKPPQKANVAVTEGKSNKDAAEHSVKTGPKASVLNEKSSICEDSSDDDTKRVPVQAPRKIPVKKLPSKKKTYSDEDSGEEISVTSKKMSENKNGSDCLTSKKKKTYDESDEDTEEAIVKVDRNATKKEVGAQKPKINFNPVASSDHHERFRQNGAGTAGAKKRDSDRFGDEDDLSAPVVKKTVTTD